MKKLCIIIPSLIVSFFALIFFPYYFSSSKKTVLIDKEPPGLLLLESKESILTGDIFLDNGYYAFDNKDGDLKDKVEITNNVDNSVAGDYSVIYKVCDKSNNCTKKERKITVIDRNNAASKIPILAYHNFMTNEEKSIYKKNDKYTMNITNFENQMKYLKDNDYKVIDLNTFNKWYSKEIELTKKSVVITIDDGNISSYRYAIPVLNKYEFKATVFVITGRISSGPLEWNPKTNLFYDKTIIKSINENYPNISLESHSNSLHGEFNGTPSKQQIIDDLNISKTILNANYFAYPFGGSSKEYEEAIKEVGFNLAFAFGNSVKATQESNQFNIPRININEETSFKKFIEYLNQ